MRRAAILTAAVAALLGPTALAFFSGGYFDVPRLVAALVAWALVLVAAVASPQPLPTSASGRMAIAGLGLLCAWTGVSLAWAPLSAPATDDLVRLLLYLAAVLAAAALFRGRRQLRMVEPLLASGVVVVIGYGLSGRLLPGLIDLERSVLAGGRLEQPITYWNAEGALAAMGLVLCARLAGDRSRPIAVRALGAASCAPLGMGVYLSYSRGAMAAAAVGLSVLLAAAPSRSQLRAVALGAIAAVAAAACSAAFPGVASLEGSLADRETEGAVMLGILAVVMLAAGLACAWAGHAEVRARLEMGTLAVARRLPGVAMVLVVLTLAGLVAGGLGERGETDSREEFGRLTSLKSTRYDYWRIGVDAFGAHPLKGVGTAGFRVVWLRERPVPASAVDLHSLPLETAVELGIVGLAALALFLAGVGVSARRALRGRSPPLAGAAAAVTVWLMHATIDWDWEMPAVTLPALASIGALIAASEAPSEQVTAMPATDARPADRAA